MSKYFGAKHPTKFSGQEITVKKACKKKEKATETRENALNDQLAVKCTKLHE